MESKPKDFAKIPHKNWILTKLSHVNEAMKDFQTELYDKTDGKECHFLRILRVGPLVEDKISVAAGKLVVTPISSGHFLDRLSKKFEEDYYLIQEDDILAFVDM